MSTTTSVAYDSFKPSVIAPWTLLGILAYFFLPWLALEYGLTDATFDEYLDALGWKNNGTTFIVPLFFFLFLIAPRFVSSSRHCGLLFTGASTFAVLATFAYFIAADLSMGLGTAVILLALSALFAIGVAEIGFQRGDRFIAGSVIFVIFLVCVFIFFPTWTIFQTLLFNSEGSFAPLQFFTIVTAFGVGRVIFNTLLLAFSVGAATTLFGLLFSLYASRTTSPLRYLIRVFYILPIITPPFVVGMALILLVGRAGMINDALMFLFGPQGILLPGTFARSGYIYGFWGIFLAQTLSLTPVAYMVLNGMLATINPAMEEAALTMRAGRWETLRDVTLPLLRPGIANAFLLCMISSAADFGNPLVLGGDYDVLSTEIYFSIAGAQLDFAKASALGVLLLLLSLSVFMIQKRWVGQKSYVTVTGIQTAGQVIPLPARLQKMLSVFVVVWLLLVGILYFSIFLGGFVKQWGADYTLTIAHHEELWLGGFSSGAWPSFINSLLFAFIAAPVTALIGILIAYIISRKSFFGRGIIDFGTVLIFAIPGTVTGVAYILAFNTPPVELTGTAAILIITMAIRAMPVGIRGGISALSQISESLEEASVLQRAGSLKTIRSVLIPLIRSTIVSSMAYSFIRSMTTVSAVIFLATAGTNVATTYILSRVESGDTGVAVAYGSILILTMLVFTLAVEVITGRSRVERHVKKTEKTRK